MKSQTIHGNPLGEVVNPSSAIGFRLEDDHGKWIEARVVDGTLKIEWGVPLSPPVIDEYVATKLDDPMGQRYGRILRDPPRKIVDYPCPVEFRDPAPPVRTIAEYMQLTRDLFDHGHPTEEQLIAAAKPGQWVMRNDGKTTRQMQQAPQHAVYLWPNDQLHYPRRLASDLKRSDLKIISVNAVRNEIIGARRKNFVIDHACRLNRHVQRLMVAAKVTGSRVFTAVPESGS